jgi:phospholipase/carboxylesterase
MPLFHRLLPPRTPSPCPPLLVLLHGIGADEADLLPIAPHLDARFLFLSVRAPRQAPAMGYAWYDIDFSRRPPVSDAGQALESRDRLLELLASAPARYRADPARVFLFGFSQGAVMAYAAALARPDLVRGLVAHSGRLLPETLVEPPPRWLDRLEALVLHGEEDEVIPAAQGRAAVEALRPRLGERLGWHFLPGLHHEVSPQSLALASRWLTERLGR